MLQSFWAKTLMVASLFSVCTTPASAQFYPSLNTSHYRVGELEWSYRIDKDPLTDERVLTFSTEGSIWPQGMSDGSLFFIVRDTVLEEISIYPGTIGGYSSLELRFGSDVAVDVPFESVNDGRTIRIREPGDYAARILMVNRITARLSGIRGSRTIVFEYPDINRFLAEIDEVRAIEAFWYAPVSKSLAYGTIEFPYALSWPVDVESAVFQVPGVEGALSYQFWGDDPDNNLGYGAAVTDIPVSLGVIDAEAARIMLETMIDTTIAGSDTTFGGEGDIEVRDNTSFGTRQALRVVVARETVPKVFHIYRAVAVGNQIVLVRVAGADSLANRNAARRFIDSLVIEDERG